MVQWRDKFLQHGLFHARGSDAAERRRAATVPLITRLDERFIHRVLGSRLLDSAGVRRLAPAVGQAGIATTNDSNRAMGFWRPRYLLRDA